MKPTQLLNDDGSASMATMLMASHHAFRRDLARFHTALRTFEPARESALREEWTSYFQALHGHHTQEDTNIFPSARTEHPHLAAAIDHLTDQHHRIDPLLARGNDAFAALPSTIDAASLIDELALLLDAHLDMEEAVLIPTLRGAKQFPTPPDEAMAAMYAEGFAWALHGISPVVIDKMREILPPVLLERIPEAVKRYTARCELVWGHTVPTFSTTSNPGV